LLGNLEGGSFTGNFGRKRKCVSGFLCLGRRGHSKVSLGADGTDEKNFYMAKLVREMEVEKLG